MCPQGANLTPPPVGYLSQSYDERGHEYKVPNYCLSRPKPRRENASDPLLSPSRRHAQKEDLKIELDSKIRIRLDGKKDLKLEVSSEDTILSCKSRLSLAESVPVSTQIWCYSGKVLRNSQSVKQLNIPKDHRVQVCVLK
eukprot:TRINITY_DN2140_c0_g1_i2.p1 TRINITY_DN2140_c0_g1~~TRINITY_DN2140_c0_g1_i2.p1  ORF type:complete len:140 (+),score=28.62 TRINITY_DN2140_c0_g1_i2:506-925(+)